MKTIPRGALGQAQVEVTPDTLASRCKSGAVDVFSTPNLVLLMEMAAVDAVEKYLDPGEVTVGSSVDIRHTAPTPLGFTVTATARLTGVDGRRLIFQVEAHDGCDSVGSGTHERFLVTTDRFISRVSEKSTRKSRCSVEVEKSNQI